MTIRAWELTPDRGTPISPELAAGRLTEESVPVWIDIPTEELASVDKLRVKLPGHLLAWEDASKSSQRPKFEHHGDHFFLIVRSLDTSHDWLGMQGRVKYFVSEAGLSIYDRFRFGLRNQLRQLIKLAINCSFTTW